MRLAAHILRVAISALALNFCRSPFFIDRMKVLLALLLLTGSAIAQQNLIPNGSFSDPVPLKGYRVDFPYQDWYAKNAGYLSQTTMAGRKCAMISLPPGVAGNEGGKIETALVPAEPGATYRVEVSALLPDFSAKIHCECYAVDPRAELVRADEETKGVRITIMRRPAMDGLPALVQIYRAQMPDAPKGGQWAKVEREFTLPLEWKAAGTMVKPAYLTIKAFTYEATMGAGKAYFTDFKLTKIKSAAPGAAPKQGGAKGVYDNKPQ